MATAARQTIRELMFDRYRLGRRGTNTGTSVSAITDDGTFGGAGAADRIENGCEVRITSGTGAPADEESKLDSRPVKTTGTMNLDPSLTAALASGDTFEILYKPFRYYEVDDAIDYAVTEKLWEKRDVPITLATDGDMLDSALGFPNVSSGVSAPTKSAATFPFGLRELHVENSSANGYVTSFEIPVEAGTIYFLEATARVTTTPATNTASLALRDLTNGADITLDESTTTEQEPTILWNPNTSIPAGCELVEMRIGGVESDADSFWSNVQFRKNDARHFVLQDRVQADSIGRVFTLTNKEWHNRGERDRRYIGHTIHMLGQGLWQIQVNRNVGGRSLWYEEFVKGIALGSDTSTTGIPKEHVAAVATMYLLRGYADDERWRPELAKASADWAQYMGQYDELRSYPDRAVRDIVLPRV